MSKGTAQHVANLMSIENDLNQKIRELKDEDEFIVKNNHSVESQISTLPSAITLQGKNQELKNSLATEQKKADQLDDQITKEISFNEALTTLLGQYDEYNPISQNGLDPQLMGDLTLEEQATNINNLITQALN